MENEKLKMNTKKCNPYAGASNYHTARQRQSQVCLSTRTCASYAGFRSSVMRIRATSGLRFCATLSTQSGFAYGWSGANPDSEQTVPACARHIRHGSVSLEQIQDSCPVRRTLNLKKYIK